MLDKSVLDRGVLDCAKHDHLACDGDQRHFQRDLNQLRNGNFGHGQPFTLSRAEVDFTYLTCVARILLFTRTPSARASREMPCRVEPARGPGHCQPARSDSCSLEGGTPAVPQSACLLTHPCQLLQEWYAR